VNAVAREGSVPCPARELNHQIILPDWDSGRNLHGGAPVANADRAADGLSESDDAMTFVIEVNGDTHFEIEFLGPGVETFVFTFGRPAAQPSNHGG
jgi:hypothetical protein